MERRTPRQAIAILERRLPAVWPERLRLAVLLDLVGSAVGVNGTTIVCGLGRETLALVASQLQAGVNTVELPDGAETAAVWMAERLRARGFERVALVAADALGPEPRLLTTALSTAARTGQAAARGTGSRPNLVAGAEGALDWVRSLEQADVGLPGVTWLEPLPALADLAGLADAREAAGGRARWLPRTRAWLASEDV